MSAPVRILIRSARERSIRLKTAVPRLASMTSLLLLLFAPPLGLSVASAQEGAAQSDPFAGVEEMIVVGGDSAALLSDTTTSAIAFDSGDLEAYGVNDLGDIAGYVPNLEIRTANATNASFFVRGVGLQDFGANAASSVPIFQDGVPRNPSATQLVGLFDIGNLSVNKGPQATGNYRNASAGAIVIQTRMPEPEFSGSASVTLAQISSVDARDANRYEFQAAMSAPLYEDILSTRVAMRYEHENPWFENGCANRLGYADRPVRTSGGSNTIGAAQFCGENVTRFDGIGDPSPGNGISQVQPFLSKYLGEVDDFGFRGSVRLQPPDSGMDFVARLEISRLNRDSTLGQVFGTGGQGAQLGGQDRAGYRDPDITSRIQEYRAALDAQIQAQIDAGANPRDFPRARERDRIAQGFVARELYKDPLDQHPYRGDFDSPGRLILETWVATVGGKIDIGETLLEVNAGYIDYRLSESRDVDLTPNIAFPSEGNNQAWETYASVDYSGDTLGDIPLSWKVGGWNILQKVEAFTKQTVLGNPRFNTFSEEIYGFGAFGEVEYEFLEGFTIAGGIRYNWERKDFEVEQERTLGGVGGGGGGLLDVIGSQNQRTWDALTGNAEIRYAFTEDIEAFAKYSRGFKAGHFNASRPQDAKDPLTGFADPEQIDAFEWGLNFALWEGRISGSAAFFLYNYENYQVFRLTNNFGQIFRTIESAKLARNYGGDFSVVISPFEGILPEAIEGFRIKLDAGWLEAKYLDFSTVETTDNGEVQLGVPIDYSGNPLISAPNLSVTGTFTWPIVTNTLGTVTPQYDFTWNDDTPFDPNNGRGELTTFGESRYPNYLIGNRAMILHNVRLSWTPPGDSGFTASGWCRNVTDQKQKTFAVDISRYTSSQLIFVGEPRMCGADLRYTF